VTGWSDVFFFFVYGDWNVHGTGKKKRNLTEARAGGCRKGSYVGTDLKTHEEKEKKRRWRACGRKVKQTVVEDGRKIRK
jgi:ribosomal protein L28